MKELSFADVSRHFHLPLTQAADRLNVSVTLVKHICRENGVSRWPFRKLQSRMKRERIARKDPPPAASCHAAAAEAMTAAAGMDAELAAADVQQSQLLEHYLASLVDFVDSIDSDPLDLSERSSTFGSMVDQTLEGAHLRGWNSFAADLERYGGLAISPIDDGVTAAAVTAARSPAAHAEAPSDAQQPTTPTAATTGDGSSDGSLGERGKTRRVRKGKVFSFADVSRNFHLPLTLAAEQLNVSVTLVKRVCRENGVSRWPYRKLQARMRKEPIHRERESAYDAQYAQGDDGRRAAAAAVSAAFWPSCGAHASARRDGGAPNLMASVRLDDDILVLGGADVDLGELPQPSSTEAATKAAAACWQPPHAQPAPALHSAAHDALAPTLSATRTEAGGSVAPFGSAAWVALAFGAHSLPQSHSQPWAVPQCNDMS